MKAVMGLSDAATKVMDQGTRRFQSTEQDPPSQQIRLSSRFTQSIRDDSLSLEVRVTCAGHQLRTPCVTCLRKKRTRPSVLSNGVCWCVASHPRASQRP